MVELWKCDRVPKGLHGREGGSIKQPITLSNTVTFH
jgi:hypothetical protein